jgi:hypothetical protein
LRSGPSGCATLAVAGPSPSSPPWCATSIGLRTWPSSAPRGRGRRAARCGNFIDAGASS